MFNNDIIFINTDDEEKKVTLNKEERSIRNHFFTLLNSATQYAEIGDFNQSRHYIKKLYDIPDNIINNIDLKSFKGENNNERLDDAVYQAIISSNKEQEIAKNTYCLRTCIQYQDQNNVNSFINYITKFKIGIHYEDKRVINKLKTLFIACKDYYKFYNGFAASTMVEAADTDKIQAEANPGPETEEQTETAEETVIDDAEKDLADLINKYGADKIKDLLNLKVAPKIVPVDNTNEEAKKIFDNFFGEPEINANNINWLKRDIVHKAQKAQRGAVKDCIAFINYFMTESAITTLIFKKWRRDIEYTPLVKRVCELVINHLCKNKVLQPYYKNNKKTLDNLVGFTLRPELMSEFYLKGNNEGLLYQTQDIKPAYYILTKDKVIKRDTWQEIPISQAYLNGLASMHYLNKVTIDGNSYDNLAM